MVTMTPSGAMLPRRRRGSDATTQRAGRDAAAARRPLRRLTRELEYEASPNLVGSVEETSATASQENLPSSLARRRAARRPLPPQIASTLLRTPHLTMAGRYRVKGKKGTKVREGCEISSALVCDLKQDTIVCRRAEIRGRPPEAAAGQDERRSSPWRSSRMAGTRA